MKASPYRGWTRRVMDESRRLAGLDPWRQAAH